MMDSPVRRIRTRRFADDRGSFCETWVEPRWRAQGVDVAFVQDNESRSVRVGTIRGIHFQAPPHAQDKLVRCVTGRILDYAVDLRKGSPTFGRHVVAELSAENGDQLFIPVGFGHAFVTLEPDTIVAYKVSDGYAPETDGGVIWDDPDLAIDWPLPAEGPTLSAKDERLPRLKDFDSPFPYDGRPLDGIAGAD
jgi:dTDP-4-dehydrorhamnose 3,5-epimerase